MEYDRSKGFSVFVPEVAKQHDVFAGVIAFVVLVSARANF